jgi:hypothetical protein
MTCIIHRDQGVIPGIGFEHINGPRFLEDMPETFITRLQQTEQDDPIDDRMTDKTSVCPEWWSTRSSKAFIVRILRASRVS